MRKLIIAVLVLALLVGGAVVYLRVTTAATSAGVRFPLTGGQRALLASVPPDAEDLAFLPAAAALHAKLLANPVARDPVQKWSERNQVPRPWMLGGGDVVIWKKGKTIRYAVRLDPFRAALLHAYVFVTASDAFVINPSAQPQQDSSIFDLANGLPPGDVLVVQRERGRAYPPIGRPAVSSVQIGAREIVITSRSAVSSGRGPRAEGRGPIFARGALLSASFAEAPRIAGDLNRLFGTKISEALAGGGSIVLYDIDTGTLLPSPRGVIVLPPTPASRDAADRLSGVADVRDTPNGILISFDRASVDAYLRDQTVEGQWPATDWALRMDAQRMIPVLHALGDNTALRIATPRIYRSVRDLRGWIGALSAADTIEAARSGTAGVEELRVRISSK